MTAVRLPSRSQAGFSLAELLIAVTILLIISSAVTSAVLQMTSSQRTIWNRTQLHAGVRSATELLQQEVGQAGRIALPGPATLSAAVTRGSRTVGVKINGAVPATMSGFFVGERLIVGAGGPHDVSGAPIPCDETRACQETVIVTAVDTAAKTLTAEFFYPHPLVAGAGAPVTVLGGFATGIVPDKKPDSSPYPNGSDGTHLKLYGDINGDGNMVYIEYTCDPAPRAPALPATSPPGTGNLYRNVMSYDQTTAKVAVTSSQVLLNNIQPHPGKTPAETACFAYMPTPLPVVTSVVDAACACPLLGQAFVLDVAITLTVQTQSIDPVTREFQLETKALLNVSPRNVFNVWQQASAGVADRVQPMPATVIALLP